MPEETKVNQQEEIVVRSELECLYNILDVVETERIKQELDIDLLKRQLILEANPATVKNIERQVNVVEEEKKERVEKIRIAKRIVEEVKKNVSQEEQDKIFKKTYSLIERLYVFLTESTKTVIQGELDIAFWTQRLKDGKETKDPVRKATLQNQLAEFKRNKEQEEAKIKLLTRMIEQEKKKLDNEILIKVLEKVKVLSPQDHVRMMVDWFGMTIVSLQINLRYWETRLIDQSQPEVRERISAVFIPNIKESIELNKQARERSEKYIETLDKEAAMPKEETLN